MCANGACPVVFVKFLAALRRYIQFYRSPHVASVMVYKIASQIQLVAVCDIQLTSEIRILLDAIICGSPAGDIDI